MKKGQVNEEANRKKNKEERAKNEEICRKREKRRKKI